MEALATGVTMSGKDGTIVIAGKSIATPVIVAFVAISVISASLGGYFLYKYLTDGDDEKDEKPVLPVLDRSIKFPRDEGSHGEPFEAWRIQVDLEAYNGKRYALSVIFHKDDKVDQKEAMLSPVTTGGGRNYVFVADGTMECSNESLDLTFLSGTTRDVFISTDDYRYRLHLNLATNATGPTNLTLDLVDTKRYPVLPFNEGRRSDYTIGSSFEYFQSRLSVTGVCNISGWEGYVQGSAWVHHSWDAMNRYPEESHLIQLDDGREIWAYQMWNASKLPYKSTLVVVEANGTYSESEDVDFDISYLRYSYDRAILPDIIAYPSKWTIASESEDLEIEISGFNEEQFMLNKWAGLSSVEGKLDGTPVAGTSFSSITSRFYANPSVTSVYSVWFNDIDYIPLETFSVRATVSDSLPIRQVILRYNVSRGTAPTDPQYTETEMFPMDDGYYYGGFPTPPQNYVVSWKIIVIDILDAQGESERFNTPIEFYLPPEG